MKVVLTLFTMLVFVSYYAQNITNSKFLVGTEAGINVNQSDYVNDTKKTSLQLGVLAEYQISKNFSVMSKIKHYESQVIFTYSEFIGSGMFGNHYKFHNCTYNGKIISIMLTINYNLKIYKKLSGSLRIGPSLNSEISKNYDYPLEVKRDYNSFFVGINEGANLNYNTDKLIYFVGFESNFGAERGTTTGKDWNNKNQTQRYKMENYLFNLGVKFKIK